MVSFLGSSSLSAHCTFVFLKSRLSKWVQRKKKKKRKEFQWPWIMKISGSFLPKLCVLFSACSIAVMIINMKVSSQKSRLYPLQTYWFVCFLATQVMHTVSPALFSPCARSRIRSIVGSFPQRIFYAFEFDVFIVKLSIASQVEN